MGLKRGVMVARSLIAGLLVASVSACGSGNASGSASTSRTEQQDTSGDSRALGIDAVKWPKDLSGARALLERMPDELDGMRGTHREPAETLIQLEYRVRKESAVAVVSAVSEEVKDPRNVLAGMFGLLFACQKGSYVGIAPQLGGGGEQAGPTVVQDDSPNVNDQLWWFACTVAGAEGDPTLRGQAVGWAGGDVAWLTISPNKTVARRLIAALVEAA